MRRRSTTQGVEEHLLPLRKTPPAEYNNNNNHHHHHHHHGRNNSHLSSKAAHTHFGFVVCVVVGVVMILLVGWKRTKSSPKSSSRFPYGRDRHADCPSLSRADCTAHRSTWLSLCPHSCSLRGVSVDTLTRADRLEDAALGVAQFVWLQQPEIDCRDAATVPCTDWAEQGQCLSHPETMRQECPKTCLVCWGNDDDDYENDDENEARTVTIDFGVAQERPEVEDVVVVPSPSSSDDQQDDDNNDDSPPRRQRSFDDVLWETQEYMLQIYQSPDDWMYRKDCRNLDPRCTQSAARGECHGRSDALLMMVTCAPACRACHALDYQRRCHVDPERDVPVVDRLEQVFAAERLRTVHPAHQMELVSSPNHGGGDEENNDYPVEDPANLPWVVVLDDLLTAQDCDWLIQKGYDIGFDETSVITDEINEEGVFGHDTGKVRTSRDAWCFDCEDDVTGRTILDKLTNVTGIPLSHTEYLELLKYETGGYYQEHHDVIETQGHERCGNRILTLYIYLNDVEEGGELVFPYLGKKIVPKRGRAVLWSNVDTDDFTAMQSYTFHEAEPVRKGQKYGANLWFHLYNAREALAADCCQ